MSQQFNLVCIHPFHGYEKGQLVSDPGEVENLLKDRDHHFVKIAAPPAEETKMTPVPPMLPLTA